MTNLEIIEKIKNDLGEIELFNERIKDPDCFKFMEKIDSIYNLLEKIKNK